MNWGKGKNYFFLIFKFSAACKKSLNFQRENIELYLKGCESFGLKAQDLFQVNDLYESKNLYMIVDNLYCLGGNVRTLWGGKNTFTFYWVRFQVVFTKTVPPTSKCNRWNVCMKGTTSAPKSALRYIVDKVKLLVAIWGTLLQCQCPELKFPIKVFYMS